jgi:hypothetical protein
MFNSYISHSVIRVLMKLICTQFYRVSWNHNLWVWILQAVRLLFIYFHMFDSKIFI